MDFLAEIRVAARTLIKNPGFTAAAVLMLALGIGINATVFNVTSAVLFKGFPMVARHDRVVYISDSGLCCVSYADFLDWRVQAKSFTGMAIVHGVQIVLGDQNGFAERDEATEVSANTFALVGQRPLLGRDFTPADEKDGAAPVAILNYGFWERRFARDPAILGQTVRMNGKPTAIIGIMPRGFTFPQTVDVWVPLVQTLSVLKRENRDTWFVLGRLRDGVTFESARTEMEGIEKRLMAAHPFTNLDFHLAVLRFHEFFIGPNALKIYGSMWGAVGFVLLIACANLANLMLARAVGRTREISVRLALGAGRWRIIRQLLIESVTLASLGGLLGWWLATWGVHAYAAAMATKSSWLILDYDMDYRVVWYLVAISVGTGLLFGLAPALRLARLDINTSLRDGGRGTTGGGRAKSLSTLLVTAEMALAVVLLAGAGVMIRSFLKISNANLGVNTANVLAAVMSPPAAAYPTPESQIAFFDHVRSRLEATSGFDSITIASQLPPCCAGHYQYQLADAPADTSNDDERRQTHLSGIIIGPGYFKTLGASVVSGRDFNDADGVAGRPVAVVNQRLAAKFWPGENAVGKRLRLLGGTTPGPWITVVGVASNIVQTDMNRQAFDPLLYLPYRQRVSGGMWVIARTRIAPANLIAVFRRDVQAVDPGLPIYGPIPLARRLDVFLDTRFYGGLFAIFAAIALLLASIGLYAVIAHSVSQRTQEIGVRMALGATARDICGLVFRQGMIPLAIGLALGLAGSLAVNRILQSELVQVSPSDPLTLIVASAVLILAAALGCWLPARRALRVDPLVALRHE